MTSRQRGKRALLDEQRNTTLTTPSVAEPPLPSLDESPIPRREPRRVGIDLAPLCGRLSGVGIYVKYLMRELLQRPGVEWTYPAAATGLWRINRRRQQLATHLGPQGRQVACRWLPGAELAGRIVPLRWVVPRLDLYHITSTLCWFRPTGIPTVVTAYDIAWLRVPEEICPRPPHWGLRRLPGLFRSAQRVLCISETTKTDVAELAGVPEERLVVTPLAARPDFHPPADESAREQARARLTGGKPFFLAVGTLEPRKNLPRLIEAFALLRRRGCEHRLVLAGSAGWGAAAVQEAIERHRVADAVDLAGYVDDAALREYLWAADAMVMVSLYEGFGLPVLEAMACGTPVVVSQAGSLPEVTGGAGLVVDPMDVDAISAALDKIAGDADLRERLRTCGLERQRRFTWQETARLTWNAYQEACG